MCLRNFKYIPDDVINLITGLIWTMRPQPVVLTFRSCYKLPHAYIQRSWLNKENIFKLNFDNIYSEFRYGKI